MSTFYDIPKEIEQTDDIIPIITFDDMRNKKVKVLYVDGTKKYIIIGLILVNQ